MALPSLDNPLIGKGIIVLIDEIDLHLHPAWQRAIIPALEKTFPNIQLITTTHSAQVLSTVNKENVFLLEDFKVVPTIPHTFGKDSNSILNDLFGVGERLNEAKKEFQELYHLIDDENKKEEAERKLIEMEEKYGNDDVEVVRAKLHFDFLTQ